MNITLQYSLVANDFAKGIETGLIDWQEARQWADIVIESTENPDSKMIDISLCLSSAEMISALHAFPENGQPDVIAYGLFAKLQDANVDDVENLASGIQKAMQIARHCNLNEAVYYEFDALDDDLFLARDGAYGSIQECRSDYTNLLAKFAQPLKIT